MKLDHYELALVEIAKEISLYLQKSGVRKADADDISQDLFVKLLESHLDIPYSKLRAWMYRTAIRQYIDRYRRDIKYQDILRKEFFTKDSMTDFDQEDNSDLKDLVRQLPPKDQTIIELYYFQGFSLEEISNLLGIRKGNAKVRLSRARQKLRQILIKEKGLNNENIKRF